MGLFSKTPSRIRQIAEAMASTVIEKSSGATIEVVATLNKSPDNYTDKYEFNEHNLGSVRIAVSVEMLHHIQALFANHVEKDEITNETLQSLSNRGNWNNEAITKHAIHVYSLKKRAEIEGRKPGFASYNSLIGSMKCIGVKDKNRLADTDSIEEIFNTLTGLSSGWELYKNGKI